MIDINLLPWRNEQRKNNKQALLISATIAIFIALVAILLIHNHYANKISIQEVRNQLLRKEIRVVVAKSQELEKFKDIKAELTHKIQTLENIRYERYQTLKLFHEIASITPDGIFLQKMDRDKNTITLTGYANSNALISRLIKKIDDEKHFINPTINEVTTKMGDTSRTIGFELKFNLALLHPNIKMPKD